jgi:hypothetical protein
VTARRISLANTVSRDGARDPIAGVVLVDIAVIQREQVELRPVERERARAILVVEHPTLRDRDSPVIPAKLVTEHTPVQV